ncbi:hypothetical protein [Lacrimispora amygdalina]|uniref:hypothetical protein n=1 Tax=Lacrimispora amygdalina TaxID=253257 RepID=UPI0031F92233
MSNPEELKLKKAEFKEHVLSSDDVYELSEELHEDAQDYFYSGVISFAEGIDSIYQHRYSWATVKLYYSIFYLIRASMACKDIGLLRNKSMYRIKLLEGEKPYGSDKRNYNSSHEGTINHYKDIFASSDKLLTNKIEDIDAYAWMQNVREIVNYREVSFLEPNHLSVWNIFAQSVDDGSINQLLQIIEEDEDYTYCFQEEYAIVGIPIKRMLQTIADFSEKGMLNGNCIRRLGYTKDLVLYNERSLKIMKQIYN